MYTILQKVIKNVNRLVGFKKSYVIQWGESGKNLTFAYKVGGWVKKRPKNAYVIYEWSLGALSTDDILKDYYVYLPILHF